MNTGQSPAWLVYQRCVAAFTHEQYGGIDVTIQPNVKLIGSISGRSRQIDVLIDARWMDDAKKRIIVDAKFRKDKVDINDVEAIVGMMQDCRADRAVIVCNAGFTNAAILRAQDAICITMLTLEDALKYGWVYRPCLGDCLNKPEVSKRGMVLWGEYLSYGIEHGLWLNLQIGKCDVCHNFHVWCWGCGKKFAVPDKQIIICDCNLAWGSIPESHESGHVGKPNSIWLLMREDNNPTKLPVPFDRKPIR